MFVIFSKEKRLVKIVILAVSVAFLLIAIAFYLIIVKNKKSVEIHNTDIFDINKYCAEYTMNIYSNKNQNRYNIKEKYINSNGEYIRMDVTSNENEFSYIITPNSINIKSQEQLSMLKLDGYSNNKLNLQSLSTFFSLKNYITNEEKNTESCSLSETFQDDNITYKIKINNNSEKIKDMLGENLNITSLELIVNRETKLPIQYIVYTNDEKVYLDINYEKFQINSDFDMKVFDF